MLTWFDILLITLLAAATALGARRGLAGLAWGLGGVAAAFAANALGLGALAALAFALLMSFGLSVLLRRALPAPLYQPWHLLLGGMGGLVLGSALIAALALSFPLSISVTPAGKRAVYPSSNLAPGLYAAVAGSIVQQTLHNAWNGPRTLRVLLIPDRAR